jgi:hypothetical protein
VNTGVVGILPILLCSSNDVGQVAFKAITRLHHIIYPLDDNKNQAAGGSRRKTIRAIAPPITFYSLLSKPSVARSTLVLLLLLVSRKLVSASVARTEPAYFLPPTVCQQIS